SRVARTRPQPRRHARWLEMLARLSLGCSTPAAVTYDTLSAVMTSWLPAVSSTCIVLIAVWPADGAIEQTRHVVSSFRSRHLARGVPPRHRTSRFGATARAAPLRCRRTGC